MDICVNPKKNVKIRASAQVHILACAMKDIVFTCGFKRERERESERILNAGTEKLILNMYIGLNGWKYVIFKETVSEGSFHVPR